MDPAAAAAAAVAGAANVELGRLPLWYGLPGKDTFTAEQWIERLRKSRVTAGWNDAQTVGYFYNALREDGLLWYESLPIQRIDFNNVDTLIAEFLRTYSTTRTARTTTANLLVLQKATETVSAYNHRVCRAVMDVIDTKDPAAPELPDHLHADAIRGLAGYAALGADVKQGDFRATWQAGFDDMGQLILRNVFITGLRPLIRQRLLDQPPQTHREAVELALERERQLVEPRKAVQILEVSEGLLEDGEMSQETVELEIDALNKRMEKLRAFRGRGRGHSRGASRGRGSSSASRSAKCYYCGKMGHMQRECNTRKREGGPMKDANGKPYKSHVSEVTNPNPNSQPNSEQAVGSQSQPEHPFNTYVENVELLNW
jgi:hypothetical protein